MFVSALIDCHPSGYVYGCPIYTKATYKWAEKISTEHKLILRKGGDRSTLFGNGENSWLANIQVGHSTEGEMRAGVSNIKYNKLKYFLQTKLNHRQERSDFSHRNV